MPSCKSCEEVINREIETPINSHEWGNLRAARNFPTRNKKKRPTHVKLKRKNGKGFKIPIGDYSAPTPVYKFGEAQILSEATAIPDEQCWRMEILTSRDTEIAMKAKYPEWDGKHRLVPRPYAFARLIAKIGFGYAVAELGIDAFEPLIRSVILGRANNIFHTVGGNWVTEPPVPGGDHLTQINMHVRQGEILVIVDIRLFSQITTPSYHVVVGRIDLKNPLHVSVLEQHRLNGKLEVIPFDRI